MKICIIVLNFNGEKDTIECLFSLEKLNHKNYDVLVVDNGSSLESFNEIKHLFPNISYLNNHENLGFAEGNNRGIQKKLKKL